jgi:hypothetical protein
MNNRRRSMIRDALQMLTQAMQLLEDVGTEEQDYFDNMPESLQSGEKGIKAEDAAYALQEATDLLSNTIADLEGALL